MRNKKSLRIFNIFLCVFTLCLCLLSANLCSVKISTSQSSNGITISNTVQADTSTVQADTSKVKYDNLKAYSTPDDSATVSPDTFSFTSGSANVTISSNTITLIHTETSESITITCQLNEGYKFLYWSVGGTVISGSCTVTISSSTDVVAACEKMEDGETLTDDERNSGVFSGAYAFFGPIINAINSAGYAIIVVVASVGTIYCIYIACLMAKAEDAEKRDEMKKRVIGIVIAIVVTVAFILLLKLFVKFMPSLID